jgi:hypothetical protein
MRTIICDALGMGSLIERSRRDWHESLRLTARLGGRRKRRNADALRVELHALCAAPLHTRLQWLGPWGVGIQPFVVPGLAGPLRVNAVALTTI